MRLILILTALLAFQSAAASEFDEMKAAADKGDADAQFKLGVMNERGKDVPRMMLKLQSGTEKLLIKVM